MAIDPKRLAAIRNGLSSMMYEYLNGGPAYKTVQEAVPELQAAVRAGLPAQTAVSPEEYKAALAAANKQYQDSLSARLYEELGKRYGVQGYGDEDFKALQADEYARRAKTMQEMNIAGVPKEAALPEDDYFGQQRTVYKQLADAYNRINQAKQPVAQPAVKAPKPEGKSLLRESKTSLKDPGIDLIDLYVQSVKQDAEKARAGGK